MPTYLITVEIPRIHVYRVEAADEAAAKAQIDNDEVDPDEVFTDWDGSKIVGIVEADGS